jgi:hypothetical protein
MRDGLSDHESPGQLGSWTKRTFYTRPLIGGPGSEANRTKFERKGQPAATAVPCGTPYRRAKPGGAGGCRAGGVRVRSNEQTAFGLR